MRNSGNPALQLIYEKINKNAFHRLFIYSMALYIGLNPPYLLEVV